MTGAEFGSGLYYVVLVCGKMIWVTGFMIAVLLPGIVSESRNRAGETG